MSNDIDTWTLEDCLKWLRHYGMENIDIVALTAHRIQQLTSWISVSERMPEDESPVRVWCGSYECYGKWCDDANTWFIDGSHQGRVVTYWKPLDKPEGV